MADMVRGGLTSDEARAVVYRRDLDALNSAEYILIVLDGRSIDEGAAFELGYAVAKGKKCYGLQTDVRRLLPSGNNPMISARLIKTFGSLSELEFWVESIVQPMPIAN